jgi:hypothetical protein
LALVPDAELEDAVMKSGTPFLRALAATALMHRAEAGTVTAEQVLAQLEVLSTGEQFEALSAWAGELRVDANRSNGHESELTMKCRVAAFARMRALWPAAFDAKQLKLLIEKVSGPIPGSWGRSNMNDLFVPVVRDGRLTSGTLLAGWDILIKERVGGRDESGKERQCAGFFESADTEAFHAWAMAFGLATESEQRVVLESWEATRKEAAMIVRQPFLQSRNYTRYADALEKLLWLEAILGLAYVYTGDADALALRDKVVAGRGTVSMERTHFETSKLSALLCRVTVEVEARRSGAA